MTPSEVLDAQADLLDRLQHNPGFTRSLDGFAAAELRLAKGSSMNFAESLVSHVRLASAYRVTHDMTDMIQWMAADLDGTDQFHPDLAPTPAGLVCFDKPIPLADARGRTMLVHWLLWGPAMSTARYGMSGRKGLAITTFNDTWRQPDMMMDVIREQHEPDAWEQYNRSIGRWAPCGLDVGFAEMRLGPQIIPPNEDHAAEILAEGDTPMPGTNPARLWHALFLLLGQTIVSVTDEEPDRKTRRRIGKAGLPPRVSVVRLRRSEQAGERAEGESMVEWQHRWIVRQHWRWQPYGKRAAAHDGPHAYGRAEVEQGGLVQRCMVGDCDHLLRRIIIPMAVKGPEGLPLKQSEKVYSLER